MSKRNERNIRTPYIYTHISMVYIKFNIVRSKRGIFIFELRREQANALRTPCLKFLHALRRGPR